MPQKSFRALALLRLAAFCLGTSALTTPGLAATYSVGGGTITTTQADNSTDNTGSGGGFLLQPNTTGNNDTVAISGVAISSTSGRALEMGYTLPSSGSYSVVMHGSTMNTAAGSGVASVDENTSGGTISFDSTGGAPNSISGPIGIALNGNLNGGSANVSIKTGADTITTTGTTGEILYAVTSFAGTISIDSIGATLTSNGRYGISAQGGSGTIIGGLNGGIASTINVAGGYGIYTSSIGSQSITLGSTGIINALNGIFVIGHAVTIDSFGTINATANAIDGTFTSPLTVTLESSSVTRGQVLGGSAGSANLFNIVAGANITNATFNGNGGTTTLNLMANGIGAANFAVNSATNVTAFQKTGSGTWVLTGTTTNITPWTVTGGTLSISNDAALGASSGSLTLNSGILQVTASTSSSRPVTVSLGTTSISAIYVNTGSVLTENGVISGNGVLGFGSLSPIGVNGTVILNAVNTYSDGTNIESGTVRLGVGGQLPSVGGLGVNSVLDLNGQSQAIDALFGSGNILLNGGNLTVGSALGSDFGGSIQGNGTLTKIGAGTLILTGTNTYSGGTTVRGGTLQVTGSGTLGAASGSVFVLGTLDLGGTTQIQNGGVTLLSGTIRNGTLSSSGIFLLDSGSVSATLAGSGSVSGGATGTTIVSGSNTYSGGTTVSGGALEITNNQALGTGAVLLNGGALEAGAAGLTVANAIEVTSSGSSISLLGNNLTISGVISDGTTGSVLTVSNTVGSSAVLILTGANTYSGTTTIGLNTTLQVGNGGAAGSLGTGSVINIGTLIFDLNTAQTVSNVILQSGKLIQEGSGTVILTGADTYFGGTTVSAGTLQIGNGGTSGSITGNVTDNGTLAFNHSDSITFAGVISGSGGLTQVGSGTLILTGANSYTGGTTIAGGSLSISSDGNLGNGGTVMMNAGATLAFTASGTYGHAVTLAGDPTFDVAPGQTVTYSGVIADGASAGTLVKADSGTLILTSSNTYTGGTTISGGALQVGSGGPSGSIAGTVTDKGALAFDRSDNVTFANVISGSGMVAQIGSGTLTLSAANTYNGATSVSGGTLNVTGSIASSSVSVASGGTLTGTGRVGATTVASGGTLTPGSGTAPGTLSVTGNLTLASGSNFADAVTPTAAGLASVSGPAGINGNAIANFAAGTYTYGQQYTLITAAGGVSGTFSSIATPGLPTNLRGSLSYDANDVYLNLKQNFLAPSLAGNTTINQHNVVAAIDAAVSTGAAAPSGGFNALYTLSGASLNSAVDQISGQVGPNVSNAVGQSFLSFLAMSAEGGAGEAGDFAPGSAYGAASAPHRAQLNAGQTRVWGAAYGGHAGLSGDAASGAAALSASNVGLIGGADMQLADGILAGVTLGWGRQHFNSGNGSGNSTDYAFGLYGRYDIAPAYVTAAFGYGWHQIATLRVVTVAGTDVLQGKENADDFGGRIEAGWHLALDDSYTIAPYAAFAGESFESPAYGESALSGASTFALSYAAHASTLGRSELGAHLNRGYDLGNGSLTADVRAAWAHQLDDLPFAQANFENLATAGFQVAGVRPTRDTALLGADLELRYASGLFLALKGEGQFGAGTTIVEGLGSFGLRW